MTKKDNDKDNKVVDIDSKRFEQLGIPGFEKLIPPNIEETTAEQPPAQPETNPNPLALLNQAEVMPTTLRTSAESSVTLRGVQSQLAGLITNENYVNLIAASAPEVLPELLNSITNAVATSDNLLIRMAQVAEKNASMNRVFEYLTKKQEQNKVENIAGDPEKGEFYDESVEKIKKAIYKKMDADRDKAHRKARDYVSADDIKPADDDIIDAEYTTQEEPNDTEQ